VREKCEKGTWVVVNRAPVVAEFLGSDHDEMLTQVEKIGIGGAQ
jgi:hypothetical protein